MSVVTVGSVLMGSVAEIAMVVLRVWVLIVVVVAEAVI